MMTENKRFLRSPALRNALYDSTDGQCALCGIVLEPGWHADHSVPWVITKQTNIFEMEPMCPSCNARKGVSMEAVNFWNLVNGSALKPGQRTAIDTIFSRVREGADAVSIVLPPGYGKSDVILLSSAMLNLYKMACRTLILEPAENLRSQIVDRDEVQASVDRYKLPSFWGLSQIMYEAKKAPEKPWPPGRNRDAAIISMTMQLANRDANRQFLEQWVDAQRRLHGAPVLVFVDEAHTGSDQNEWGNTTRALREAGAIVILLTGTPYRSDNRRIEGFKWVDVDVEPVKVYRKRRTDDAVLVDIYEGQKSILRLDPDYEHTLRESWNVDSPPSLCKILRRPFDFDLSTNNPITGEDLPATALSLMPPNQLRGHLGPFLRRDDVIRFFCHHFLLELRKRQEHEPATAGIVFVGNNDNSLEDPLDREQALKVQQALSELSPHTKVVVATNDESSEGVVALRRFQKGNGDVVIVKQMGGVGYNVPRLKVVLDLSVVRQAAPFVQRLMRAARIWRYGDEENDVQMTMVYITPDDAKGRALWEHFIGGENMGETTLTNLEYIETLQGQEGTQGPFREYDIIDIHPSDTFADSDFEEAPTTKFDKAREVEHALGAHRYLTTAFIANRLHLLEPIFASAPPHRPEETARPDEVAPSITHQSVVVVEDGNLARKEAQDKINWTARRVAEKRLGRKYIPGDKAFKPMVANVMYHHKKACGIAHKKPDQFTAEEAERLQASLEKEMNQ